MGARKSPLIAVVGVALVVAGCGGGERRAAPPRPKLPAPIAMALAARSDAVAAALAANDGCRALAEAQSLQQEAVRLINARRVPRAFQEELTSAVNDLASRIECAPPPVQDEDEHKGRGKKKDEEKNGKKGHGNGG